eukprot:5655452-Pleurochrysis_carterae.AAC.2
MATAASSSDAAGFLPPTIPRAVFEWKLRSYEIIRDGLVRSRIRWPNVPDKGISGEPWSYQKDQGAKYETNLAQEGHIVAIAR